MFDQNLIPAYMILAVAAYFFQRNIRLLINEEKLNQYIERSPKAVFWINKYGIEKTRLWARRYFFPAGALVAFMMASAAIWKISVLLRISGN